MAINTEKQKKFNTLLKPFTFNKDEVLRHFEVALLIHGHILIEDLPGVGKTTFTKAFTKLLGKQFSRIQGTSDLLPSDVLGGEVIDPQNKEISLRKGPIFSECVMVDEINRMHPKTQSAFLEAMEEKSVSIAGKRYSLPLEHLIIATQNPIEQEGTNPLPEAQRDRFACRISLGFPPEDIQKQMIQDDHIYIDEKIDDLEPIFTKNEILEMQKEVRKIYISDEIAERIVKFAHWTRTNISFKYGISPRGLSLFARAMRANAYLEGRDFVIPEDGRDLLNPFITHRIEFEEQISEKKQQEILLNKYIRIFLV